MIRFLADEDFDMDVVRGCWRRDTSFDCVRAQDVGLFAQPDEAVLKWAADHGRIVLTHDRNTLIGKAWARVDAGDRMPGVFIVPQGLEPGEAIDDILIVAACSLDDEWEGRVGFLPLKS